MMENRLLALTSILLLASAVVLSSPVKQTAASSSNKRLLGAKECTWGPSYWCSDIRSAKSCGAVSHCIQTVWEKQQYPVDNDEICNICLDMVKQARDQLESNETQADLKAVFEGSCNLIPIKLVKKECRKLADDFIPELVEALASQMNPNVVCSVAGLCNNVAIDKLLAEQPATKKAAEDDDEMTSLEETAEDGEFSCSECGTIAGQIVSRFRATDRDRVLEGFLRACGQMSSYSDGCSSIVLTYFGELYDHLNRHLSADAVCHLSGVCSARFHQHDDRKQEQEIEVRPMGGVGVLPVIGDSAAGDDVPCKLCEQLVDHLRDVLIANTTELEFKQVLEGLCKQTKSFSDECTSLVEQYYREIYETLVHNLNSNDACFMIGVCPKKDASALGSTGPLMPLLPVAVAVKHEQQKKRRPLLGENEPVWSATEIQQAQLPIDRLMGAPSSMKLDENGKFCTLCEYFMHFVQEALSEPANEDEIKEVVAGTCKRLPSSIRGECRTFVDVYGDAVIALLIQSMDPRQVCPTMRLCPASNDNIEVFAPGQVVGVTVDAHAGGDKPTCPLCLFAVSQLEESVKSDRSKENIKSAIDKLCTHLSPKLRLECTDFVDTYTAQLVEMLASDFTPQEICVFLKLCVDQRPDLSLLGMELDYHEKRQRNPPAMLPSLSGDVETNEIPDITVNGQITSEVMRFVRTPKCILCEEMAKEMEKRMKNKKSKEQIKEALEHVCDRLHKYRTKCEKYIQQHSDQIVDLVMKELSPQEICHALGFCLAKNLVDELEIVRILLEPMSVVPPQEVFSLPSVTSVAAGEILDKQQPPQCAICEFVMIQLESDLADKKTRAEIEGAVRSVCSRLPSTVTKQCNKLIDQYGAFIIKFLQTLPPKEICTKLALCEQELSVLEQAETEVVECAVCQATVNALDNLLAREQLQEHVTKYADRVCNMLPAKHYSHCDKMLWVYGISMVHQLQHSIEREQVCVNIDMCGAPMLLMREFASEENSKEDGPVVPEPVVQKHSYLLGKNQCSWGPAYWCRDESTAKECNSNEYCMDRKLGFWGE